MNLVELHEKILYPIVRIRTEKSGGSGTIIYSKPDPENPSEYLSFVITNEHVIDDAIQIKEEFDSIVKRDIKKEFFQKVCVDVFDYAYLSKVVSSNTHFADIIAYDKHYDLAVLKLDTPKQMKYCATFLPKVKANDLKVFMKIYSCGASLLHEPFANEGHITFLQEEIDNKLYYMSNSNSIFGNSGGAVFLQETGEFIGIPARITGIQLGFGVDIITWMGFFVPICKIYEFLEEQELKFLYDDSDTYREAMRRRKEKQKRALADILIGEKRS